MKLWLMQWADSGKQPTVIGEATASLASLIACAAAGPGSTGPAIAWMRNDKKVGELVGVRGSRDGDFVVFGGFIIIAVLHNNGSERAPASLGARGPG